MKNSYLRFLILTMVIAITLCLVSFLGSGGYRDGRSCLSSGFTQKSQENELIQTVLNIPDFQRVSKLPTLKKLQKVFIAIENESDRSSKGIEYSLNIGDIELIVIDSVEGIDLINTPCYEFHILSYSKGHAEIWVKMDRTGAYAEGELDFLDGKWVPDNKFKISKK